MTDSEVATKPNQEVVASDEDFFSMPGGLDDLTNDDLATPRWIVLQGLSPQLNKKNDEFVEGASIGSLFNTVTGEVRDALRVVAAAYQRRHIEWVPRDKPCPIPGLPQVTGGGLYQDYGTDDSILKECVKFEDNGSLWTPRGNELCITGTWYMIDPDNLSASFIAMSKTNFTASKKFMAAIRDEKVMRDGVLTPAPLFWRVWDLSSKNRTHENNTWEVWNHRAAELVKDHDNSSAILGAVRAMMETLDAGEMVIDVAAGEPVAGDAKEGAM